MFRATTFTAAFLLATAASTASTASAQDAVLAEVYGRGVHHYFAHEYDKAYEELTLAIDNGLRDPRVYYFRGLTAAVTGRPEEAEADWRTGAAYEARGNYTGSIGRSLARIQGAQRLELERIRQIVRLEERAAAAARNRARYQPGEAATAPAPPAAPAAPTPAAPTPAAPTPAAPTPAAPEDVETDPFADDGGLAEGEPIVESEDALGDPLAEPAPSEEAPAAPTETPPAEDFFGGDAPAEGDTGNIFGGDDEAESDDDNPFGGF